jgi:hypothetical protein
MTVDEYASSVDAILKRFGGSYATPSGHSLTDYHYSCAYPPIIIPYPEQLTPEQRRVIIERLKKKYSYGLPERC